MQLLLLLLLLLTCSFLDFSRESWTCFYPRTVIFICRIPVGRLRVVKTDNYVAKNTGMGSCSVNWFPGYRDGKWISQYIRTIFNQLNRTNRFVVRSARATATSQHI